MGPTGPTGVFNPGEALFNITGAGGSAPVAFGQDLLFRSNTLNIFVSPNPATVQIETQPNYSAVAYGGLFSSEPQSFSIAPGNIAQVRLASFMPSFNIVSFSSSVQVVSFGDYEINFTIRIAAVAVPATLAVGVWLDSGAAFIPSTSQSGLLSTTNDTLFQGSTVVSLNGGDTIDLSLQAITSATFSLSANMNASLSVKRLTPFPP